MATSIGTLSPAKRRLLTQLLRKEGASDTAHQPIPRRPSGEIAPLSFAQQRLWLVDQMLPGTPLYNIAAAVRVAGPLDVRALMHAFTSIVARHEVLRTRIATVEGQAVQLIDPASAVPVPLVDLTHLPDGWRAAAGEQIAAAECRQPFNLAAGPLFRALIVRVADDDHIVVVVMHHIASDGWSMSIVIREMSALYEAHRDHRPAALPPLPIQYADFACWQRRSLTEAVLETGLAYWSRQLADLPPLSVPSAKPRLPVQTARGRICAGWKASGGALAALAQREGATLFMALVAALQVVLHRHTGQEDLVIGTDVANRNRVDTENLIGFFVNQLVLRTDLSGRPTFRELLARVRDVTLAAYAHQDVPFERLVAAVQADRDVPWAPLFRIKLMLQNFPDEALQFTGVTFTRLLVDSATAKYDLLFNLAEHDGTLAGSVEYRTDLFDEHAIRRLLGHFSSVLEEASLDPDCRIAEMRLLTAAERHQLIAEWGDTATSVEPRLSHQRFEDRATATPDAIAVVSEEAHVTYAELDHRATRLAAYLQQLGVGPERCVAVCMERSCDLMAAFLGVLKSGGFFVPCDTTVPKARLEHVLADCRPIALMTTARWLSQAPEGDYQRISLDHWWTDDTRERPLRRSDVAGNNAAYVMYTSGSTGRPKGVIVEHRGLANYLTWCTSRYPMDEGGSLVHSSIAFDLTVTSLFAPLFVGRTVIMLPHDRTLDAFYHPRSDSSHPGLLKVTPAHLATFGHAAATRARSLTRALVIGGEALAADVLTLWRTGDRAPEIFNEYGPTETVVGSSCYRVPGDAPEAGPVPIGRPIANTTIYVLDARLQPIPIGVAGELYIGGHGVARGYLRRPEETGGRFVPNPFATAAGDRLYRTGDLARYLPSGDIEFLGRRDHQIKVRSFRVELQEIEAILCEHRGVRHAVVMVREDTPGRKQVVAYVAPHGHDQPTVEALRQFVATRLPEYMHPAAFVLMDELPLTANGKVDRAALPPPACPQPDLPTLAAAATTATEELLGALCASILGVERVNLDASFFEAGGDSLLAMILITRICEAFTIELSLREVFDAPRLRDLAARIELACREARGLVVPSLRAVERPERLPLSFAQQRLWFLEQLSPGNAAYVCPVAVRLAGALDTRALRRAIAEVVRRHEILRTTFASVDGEPMQVIAPRVDIPLPCVDLTAMTHGQRDGEVTRLAARDLREPFDLARGPLLRAVLFVLDDASHVLLLCVHHIVFDAWSIGVLIRELASSYAAAASHASSPLKELAIQYADFATWQRAWATADRLDRQLEYWRRQLADAPSPALPTDRTRPAMQTHRGAKVSFQLSPGVSTALAALSRGEGATLFMTLLAAYQALLRRYTGEHDCTVACPIASRTRIELEGLIGLFLNMLVLRTNVPGRATFRALVDRVRTVAVDAYAHQDLSFEQIVEHLHLERDASRNPLMQVMFAFQNTPVPAVTLPRLEVSPIDLDMVATRADLELYMWGSGTGLAGTICFNPDLFDRVTIQRMARQLETIFAAVTADPTVRLSDLPLLAAPERQQLCIEWNDTSQPIGPAQLVHTLFEMQARQQPDAVAVVCDERQLTYDELHRRANTLARYLRQQGIGLERPVGICLERTLEMPIALLGVLEAGGMYVPLDAGLPPERFAFMLEDVAPPVVLTDSRCRRLVPDCGAHVVCLDSEWNAISRAGAERPILAITPENAAYQMYTSGSTGWPKGVQVVHGAVVNLLASMSIEPGFACDDVLLAVTSLSFDIAALEFFLPLVQGGRLCVVSREVAADGRALARALRDSGATVMQATPMTWRLLLDAGWAGNPNLTAWCGGDTLSEVLAAQLASKTAGVWNLYGPTETTIWSATRQYRPREAGYVIGHPIQNTQIYLLDAAGEVVPVGVVGALHIAGTGLARGYWKRADQTAATFLPNPFSVEPGARLYRTGDLAKYRPDGQIEFLGRADHQIKLRGYRIELGEIETTLRRHGGVRDALALVHDHAANGPQLVGYVVADSTARPAPGELREFVKRLLPEYMVPAAFVVLDAWPLTPNGKIDRTALSAAERPPMAGDGFTPPRDAVEELMSEIWTSVLGVDRLDVHANFFDMGGHSLLATQLVARVREVFEVDVSLRELFDEPTIAGFSRLLAASADQVGHVARMYERLEAMPIEEVRAALQRKHSEAVESS